MGFTLRASVASREVKWNLASRQARRLNYGTFLIFSLFVHAALLIGITWWSIYNTAGLGGGGVVEVAMVGGGSGIVVSLRAQRSNLLGSNEIASAPSAPRNDNPSPLAGEWQGEGSAGGSGVGVGTGAGQGDPRLVAIWRKINRAKYYPEIARRQNMEGAPKVAFSIGENGKAQGVRLVESSGNELLDKAALETIERSSPLPFYPQPITIAVRYSIRDK